MRTRINKKAPHGEGREGKSIETRLEEIYQVQVSCDDAGLVTIAVLDKKGGAGKTLRPGDKLIFEKVTELFPCFEAALLSRR